MLTSSFCMHMYMCTQTHTSHTHRFRVMCLNVHSLGLVVVFVGQVSVLHMVSIFASLETISHGIPESGKRFTIT